MDEDNTRKRQKGLKGEIINKNEVRNTQIADCEHKFQKGIGKKRKGNEMENENNQTIPYDLPTNHDGRNFHRSFQKVFVLPVPSKTCMVDAGRESNRSILRCFHTLLSSKKFQFELHCSPIWWENKLLQKVAVCKGTSHVLVFCTETRGPTTQFSSNEVFAHLTFLLVQYL